MNVLDNFFTGDADEKLSRVKSVDELLTCIGFAITMGAASVKFLEDTSEAYPSGTIADAARAAHRVRQYKDQLLALRSLLCAMDRLLESRGRLSIFEELAMHEKVAGMAILAVKPELSQVTPDEDLVNIALEKLQLISPSDT